MSRFLRITRLGARSLLLHPLRSFLTALGIIIGVGTVIYMLAIIEGRSEETQRKIRARGATNILIKAKKPTEESNSSSGRSRMVSYGLTYDDAERIEVGLPQVEILVPVREVNATIYHNEHSTDSVTFATVPWYLEVSRGEVARGRWFTEREDEIAEGVCVLGAQLSRKLFLYHDPLMESVRIGSKVFTVIGVLAPTVTSDEKEGQKRDEAAYIPISAVRERFGERNVKRSSGVVEIEKVDLHQLLVQVRSLDQVLATWKALDTMLQKFHRKEDYTMEVPLKLLAEAEEEAERSKNLFGSIAAISLLVGGIGIMNIMLATVTERTREIGVRRALGAHRRDITSQFLVETLILSALGGLAGVAGGIAAAHLHEHFVPEDPATIITIQSVALAFGISALVGVLAGLYPAIRAAHMDPIRALRHE
ncbi:MAG: ABC transporter ATP-binding protein [Deltaproteobacteria bacterium]|nr:ABC transporter ATP-binding protein [Deltaproteobacteria bacterium]